LPFGGVVHINKNGRVKFNRKETIKNENCSQELDAITLQRLYTCHYQLVSNVTQVKTRDPKLLSFSSREIQAAAQQS